MRGRADAVTLNSQLIMLKFKCLPELSGRPDDQIAHPPWLPSRPSSSVSAEAFLPAGLASQTQKPSKS